MRVIIPGASGFIGKNLLDKAPKDWDIVALYNTDKGFPPFVCNLSSKKVAAEKCNLLNLHDLESLRENYGSDHELCIFLAANSDPSKSYIDPTFDLRNNTESLTNFLQLFKAKRLIFFSSGAVYEGLEGIVSPEIHISPTLPYAISKLASEAYVKHFKKRGTISEYLIVRFFGAYGPYEPSRKIFTKLVKQFYFQRRSEFSVRGNGLNLIDAMHVDDAAEGIIRMANEPLKDSVIDFCGGKPTTIQDLILEAAKTFGIAQPKMIQEGETVEYNRFYASPTPLKERYGFEPEIDLSSGLHRLAAFLETKRN